MECAQGTHEHRALVRGSAVASGMTEVARAWSPRIFVWVSQLLRVLVQGVEQAQNPNPKKWNAKGTDKRRDKGGRVETGGLAQCAQERREENAGVVCVVDV